MLITSVLAERIGWKLEVFLGPWRWDDLRISRLRREERLSAVSLALRLARKKRIATIGHGK
jgi:hypothetical protein